MKTSDQNDPQFIPQIEDLEARTAAAQAVLAAAREFLAAPERLPRCEPARGRVRRFALRLTGSNRAERLVTYPIWLAWVIASHAFVGLLLLGVVSLSTSLLMGLGRFLDAMFFFGLPVATWGAFAVGALAAIGTVAEVYDSARTRAAKCPW